MIRLKLIILFLFISGFGFGQNKSIDSIKVLIHAKSANQNLKKKHTDFENLIKAFTAASRFDSAFKYLEIWNKNYDNWPIEEKEKLRFYHLKKAELLGNIEQQSKALEQYLMLYEKIKGLDNDIDYLFQEIGNSYFALNMPDLALSFYRKAEELLLKKNDNVNLAVINNNIALYYYNKNNYDTALVYFNKSRVLRKKVNPFLEGHSMTYIGNCYVKKEQYDSALHYFKAVELIFNNPSFESSKDAEDLKDLPVAVQIRLYRVFYNLNQKDSAIYRIKKAIILSQKLNLPSMEILTLSLLGNTLCKEGKFDEGLPYLFKALELTKKFNNYKSQAEIYLSLMSHFKSKNDNLQSYKYGMLHYKLLDSLNSGRFNEQLLKVNNSINAFENLKVIEEKEEQIKIEHERTELQSRINKYLIALSILLALIIFGTIALSLKLKNKNKLINDILLRLQTSNNTKEKLLSIISHDLRTPFNHIIGYSNLLLSEINGGEISEIKKNAQQINQSSKEAFLLLDNLLHWAAWQKEELKLEIKKIDLDALINENIFLVKTKAISFNIDIQKLITEHYIFSDYNMLNVIIRNLLSNALKYAPQGSKIYIQSYKENNFCCISVQDEGKGIPPHILKELTSNETKNNILLKGNGLGISLVKEFASKINAELKIENNSNVGAKFTLKIPYHNENERVEEFSKIQEEFITHLPVEKTEKIKAFAKELSQYEIFETSELRLILHKYNSANKTDWELAITQAIFNSDETNFKKLIREVLENSN